MAMAMTVFFTFATADYKRDFITYFSAHVCKNITEVKLNLIIILYAYNSVHLPLGFLV